MLERWTAGLTRNPAERRMALRLRSSATSDSPPTSVAGERDRPRERPRRYRGATGEDDELSGDLLGDDDDRARAVALPTTSWTALLPRGVRQLLVTGEREPERDYTLSRKAGWFARAICRHGQAGVLHARGVGRARRGGARAGMTMRGRCGTRTSDRSSPRRCRPVRELDEIVPSNRQDGDRVRSSAVLSALPGLGRRPRRSLRGALPPRADRAARPLDTGRP